MEANFTLATIADDNSISQTSGFSSDSNGSIHLKNNFINKENLKRVANNSSQNSSMIQIVNKENNPKVLDNKNSPKRIETQRANK